MNLEVLIFDKGSGRDDRFLVILPNGNLYETGVRTRRVADNHIGNVNSISGGVMQYIERLPDEYNPIDVCDLPKSVSDFIESLLE